jgi:hypothetical protein
VIVPLVIVCQMYAQVAKSLRGFNLEISLLLNYFFFHE